MKALPEVRSLEIRNKISLDEANQTRKRVFPQDIKTTRTKLEEQAQIDLYFHPLIEIAFQNLRRAQTSEMRNQMRVRSEY